MKTATYTSPHVSQSFVIKYTTGEYWIYLGSMLVARRLSAPPSVGLDERIEYAKTFDLARSHIERLLAPRSMC